MNTNITQNVLRDEINSLVKSTKTIIPFSKEHFQSLSTRQDVVYLDLANYNAIEEYSFQDQIITVQTGMKIKLLQSLLLKEGKWFPVSYYDDETSLLDIILSGESGSLEQFLGGLSRHILGLENILSSGELVKSGGKVVKNVSGYDLTRFFIGSYGYFALPIKAHLRLYALPRESLTLMVQNDDWRQLLLLANQLKNINIELAYLHLFDSTLIKPQLLESKFKSKKRFVLALRTFGDSLIINTAEETIRTIFTGNKFPYSIITEDFITEDFITGDAITKDSEQDYFMQELSQIGWFTEKVIPPKLKKAKILDVAIKNKDIAKLLSTGGIGYFPFIYKIAANRLRFCLDSITELNSLIKHLNTFALDNKIVLPIAYGDDTYIRRVERLGYDTSNGDQLAEIKRQLKRQFDPANLFNPYVQL